MAAQFDGGTSNVGALLLRQVGRGLRLIPQFAQCFTDRRGPRFVEHTVETPVGQHIFGLVSAMRTSTKDPAFAAASRAGEFPRGYGPAIRA